MTTFVRRVVWVMLVSLVLAGSAASRLDGQDTTVSATMLRVLAEAADVHRTGQPVFLVADYRYPHTVIGHFPNRPQAQRLQADSGATFGVFGPFVTPRDRIPDSAPRVERVTVTTRTGGRLRTTVLNRQVDALFLSMSAIDKFAIPYYEKIYGPEYAKRLRDRFLILGPMPHRLSVADSLGGRPVRIWDPTEQRP